MSHHIHQNTKKSLISLFFQSGYAAVLGLIANILVTAIEAREVFGIYIATLSTIGILNYISDIGLAGALIQKKEVSDDDLKTVFTVQQVLIGVLVCVGIALTYHVQHFFKLQDQAVTLYWVVLVSFFISSLKTIPSVLMEREVRFGRVVQTQIIENTLFYVIVSVGILSGWGLTSFAVAVFARSVIGVVWIYRVTHWTPRVGIVRESLRELMSFGIPFQANSLLALVKDELMIIYLGRYLGLATLGEIGWAKKWAEAPIRIVMDNVSKVLFPVFSRLQNDQHELKRTIKTTIMFQTMVLGPVLLISALVMPYVVHVIPKYSKWESAVPMFQVFCVSAFLSTLSTPFMNIFNALKKPRIPLVFMIYWTIMTWALTPTAIRLYGAIGFAYVQLFLSCSCIVVIAVAQRQLQISIFEKQKTTSK